MGIESRIQKLEEWFCPAPVVVVDVHFRLPGLREHRDGQVYREDQFQEKSDELLPGAVPCIRRMQAEHRNSDGQVIQRFFVYGDE